MIDAAPAPLTAPHLFPFFSILDDIIKTTRKATPRRKPAGNKNPNALAAKATGQNKAKRAVGAAARRGLKGNAMEVDKQVQRATNGGGGRSGAAGVPRGRGARVTAPSAVSVRAKARALAGVRAPRGGNNAGGGGGSSGGVAITAPTQKAIGAAARAMKEFGFKVPKGMQMQISFVSKPTTNVVSPKAPVFKAPTNGGRGGGNNGRGGRGGGRGAGRGGGIRRNMTPR